MNGCSPDALAIDQPDILGEEREEAPHQERRDDFGVMARRLETLGELGQLLGDLARDLGAVAGGIEG